MRTNATRLPCAPSFGAALPTSRTRKRLHKVRVVSKDHLELIVVSSQLESVYTHHIGGMGGRTVWCTGDANTCPYDHGEVGAGRWGGWLAVCSAPGEYPLLLRITEECGRSEPELLASKELRGRTLEVWRKGGHEKSEMRAFLHPATDRETKVPAEPDLRDYLQAMMEAGDRPPARRTNRMSAVEVGLLAAKGQKLFLD